MKISILGSGEGTNAEAIMEASKNGLLENTEIVGVYSDVSSSKILKRAEESNIFCSYLDPGDKDSRITETQERLWIEEIKKKQPHLIVLAGFMRILSLDFLTKFDHKIINLHPSLLPSFPGLNSIKQAFNKKVKITGCTVHWVNQDIDEGEIIAQAPVRIMDGDTLKLIEQKVQAAEHMLLPWVIRDLANGSIPFN